MKYHFKDIKEDWKYSANEKIDYDIPLGLSEEYPQKVMLANVALNIGYSIGRLEAEKEKDA